MTKLDFNNLKNFCSSKDYYKNEKKLATDWEKIFTVHISDKGFVTKIRTLTKNKEMDN